MTKTISIIAIALCVLFLFLSSGNAENDQMYIFYNGLAEIIEQNMDHPEDCAAKAEVFIRDNIGRLKQAVQTGKEAARSAQENRIDEAELQRKTEELVQSKGFQAMNRFMGTYRSFGIKNPEYAEKIMEVMGEYESEFE